MKKSMLSLTLVILLSGLIACKPNPDVPQAKSNTYVLVHGAWQAPYVWQTVKDQLEKQGQHVVVVELPGHGNDTSSPVTMSIDLYAAKVIDAINSIKGKVILVGHSMGGVVVSAVAQKVPERIEKLVFIGAFVPASNQSIIDLSMLDKQSQLGASLVPSKDQLTLDVKHENIISIFCQDAPKAEQELVLAGFRVEPAIPFTNKATITDANFGKVDKVYIHTLQDHAIGTDLQKLMVAAAHITKTYSLNTGHSPFLSKPDEVTELLLTIGK